MKHQGQALIIAVIVMFLLVGLGGYFVAIINASLVQSARIEDKRQLDGISRAGLEIARNQLRFSSDGADWRPDEGPDKNNVGWIRVEKGFCKIAVSYGPVDEYTKFGDNILDKYIKISVDSVLSLPNPPDDTMATTAGIDEYQAYLKGFQNPQRFLKRSIVALMPVGLTDNLIWLTNIDGSNEPMVLGSGLLMKTPDILNSNSSATVDVFTTMDRNPTSYDFNITTNVQTTISAFYYRPVYEGPIYAKGDLQLGAGWFYLLNEKYKKEINPDIYSPYRIDAGIYKNQYDINRVDQIVATNSLSDYGTATASVMVNIQGSDKIISDSNRVSINNKSVIRTRDNDNIIPQINAPKLNEIGSGYSADRYRRLTRDSGIWNGSVNTGELGYGNGIYIDNRGDRQFDGDIDKLRDNWMMRSSDYWDNYGIYHPDKRLVSTDPGAVTIVLRDWKYTSGDTDSVDDIPRIELRYDKPFKDESGKIIDNLNKGYYSVEMPYPRNGIIFAEGNVIVINEPSSDSSRLGGLPTSKAYDIRTNPSKKPLPLIGSTTQAWGGYKDKDSTQYYVNDYNRRFDLNIVSGGTIYIQSNLLNPASRKQKYIAQIGSETNDTASGNIAWNGSNPYQSNYDSKLALFAMDNVCFNPTPALFTPPEISPRSLGDGKREKTYIIGNGSSQFVNYPFTTSGVINPGMRLLLRHGYNNLPTDSASINSSIIDSIVAGNPLFTDLSVSFQANYFDLTPQSWQISSLLSPKNGSGNNNNITLTVKSAKEYIIGAGNNETEYVEKDFLGPGMMVTGQDMQIDALIYAQRGHWFVIPGHYYNESTKPELANMRWPFPKYHEPLDVRFILNGAIVENRPAPPEDEDEWMSHWRGSNFSYYSTDGKTPEKLNPSKDPLDWDQNEWRWRNRRMGIEYHYDATLSIPVCFETIDGIKSYRPRIPKLPVADNLFNYTQVQM